MRLWLYRHNDTLISLFFYTDANQICHLRCVLLCFTAITGLKINLIKSYMMTMGMVTYMKALANTLGCKASFLPMKYFPLGAHFKASSIWDGI